MTLTDKEIELILNTLQNIEVKGFDNMDKLMALIQFFKRKGEENGNVSAEQTRNND